MGDSILVNDVPMRGDGLYNSNSGLQHAAMLYGLHLLKKAAANPSTKQPSVLKPYTIIEYGSAQGKNSIEPFSVILQGIKQTKQAQIILSDRPENDFSTLSATISCVDWRGASASLETVFTAMVPRSFYEPVIPPGLAEIGFSFACLHHLDHVPPRPAGQQPTDATRQDALREQAHRDLVSFLNLRAVEIQSGGTLVLSFVGQASSGEQNYAGPVDACRAALIDMVKEGVLPAQVAASFEVPTYNRTLNDVRTALDEVGDSWATGELFEKRMLHPAVEQLAERRSVRESEEDSLWYANTIVDWLFAVVAGYFVKALQTGFGRRLEAGEGEKLLDEWTRRTKEGFLNAHKDEECACWFIYVSLKRI